jgi:hypothetical protein
MANLPRPRVIGVIAIIAGALEVIMNVYARLVPQSFVAGTEAALLVESRRLEAALAPVDALNRNMSLLIPITGALLILVGVALLRGRPWAIRAAHVWSVLALAVLASSVTFHYVAVRPRILAAREEAVKAGASENALAGYDWKQGAATRIALLRALFPMALLLRLRRTDGERA